MSSFPHTLTYTLPTTLSFSLSLRSKSFPVSFKPKSIPVSFASLKEGSSSSTSQPLDQAHQEERQSPSSSFANMAARTAADDAMKTATERCPDTLRYDVDSNRDLKVPKPHIPRALVAADNEHPHGTVGHDHKNYTVLQQHVEFFDRNKDGIIYPWETFAGFRAIGFGWIISFLGMVFINGSMSYSTQPSWLPSPIFSIHIEKMHKAVHGSDTGVYDNEGRFVPAKFEEVFAKYAKTFPDRITFDELFEMTESLRDAYDLFGWVANKLEWGITYWLLKDEKGFVSKEAIRGVYDGSIFYHVEKKLSAKKMSKYY